MRHTTLIASALIAAATLSVAHAGDRMAAYTSLLQDVNEGAPECAVEKQTITTSDGSTREVEFRSRTVGTIGLRGTIIELGDRARLKYLGEHRLCAGGRGGEADNSTLIGIEFEWTLIE